MKKRIFQASCLLTMIGIFTSCDPESKATYYLENKSSHIVYINPGAIIVTAQPSEVATIAFIQHIGGEEDAWTIYGKAIIYNDSDTCKKAIGTDSNWIKTNPKKYAYEYRFTVEDSDF